MMLMPLSVIFLAPEDSSPNPYDSEAGSSAGLVWPLIPMLCLGFSFGGSWAASPATL